MKIRGLRIELGEVEAVLAKHPDVAQVAAVVREDNPGDKRLVAYVFGGGETAELRRHVGESLPDYMVPAVMVFVDALPLLPNGKLDRRALPVPDLGESIGNAMPRNPTEEILCGLFAEVLGLPRVGVEDSFRLRAQGHDTTRPARRDRRDRRPGLDRGRLVTGMRESGIPEARRRVRFRHPLGCAERVWKQASNAEGA